MKKLISLVLCLSILLAFAGCSKKENNNTVTGENPVATIVVKDFGTIKVGLYPEKAPNTVNNFISLANKGFYDGLTFHRIYQGFMIQGGCPDGTGSGDPGYSIKGEFRSNGYTKNDLQHTRGVISMARANDPDSAGSQFFIMHQDSSHLDGDYAAFGKVCEGMDVVDKIAGVETTYNGKEKTKPLQPVIIESVTVDTMGITYESPLTI